MSLPRQQAQEKERVLYLQDGSQMVLPMIRNEETKTDGRVRVWWSTDWTGILDCARCGGYVHGGQISTGAGWIVGYRTSPEGNYQRVCGACSCVFGAFRNQVQSIPWIDSLTVDLKKLSNGAWAALDAQGKLDYREALESMPDGVLKTEVESCLS